MGKTEERSGRQPGAGEPGPAAGGESLEGVLESVTYANEETGWSVVRLEVEGRRGTVAAVGHLPGVRVGEHLRLTGRFERDRRWGEQFKVATATPILPATVAGMERYLASGLVRGIGKVMAGRLVRHFGLETMAVIDDHPERLTEVEGIGAARQGLIRAAWAEQRTVRDVMLFLQSHGVSTAHAFRIYRQYGADAVALVRDNPYRLAEEVFGIGFRTADTIALAVGVPRESPRRVEAGVLHSLGELAESGNLFCPRAVLVRRVTESLAVEAAPVEAAIAELDRRGALRAEAPAAAPGGEAPEAGQPVYLARLHAAEVAAADLLGAIVAHPAEPVRVDIAQALRWYEEGWGIALAVPQREAVSRAMQGKVLVITGGPGTGKTTIINAIVRILERTGRRILLTAPTGRAAKRMEEATGLPARTIHRLLEFNPRRQEFDRHGGRQLEADVVVVDEMSMVDLPLFAQLLKAVPRACRLVLVGDVDQLPSVGPGNVLRDLIRSGAVEVAALTEIFRQADESLIVVSAHEVNRGEVPPPRPLAAPGAGDHAAAAGDFFFVAEEDPEAILETVKRLAAREIPARFGLDAVDEIQVLTPMHRGLLGSVNLNTELQRLLNPRGEQIARAGRLFRVGDKVMQIRNNYELEVFNGDLGRIAAVDEEAQEVVVRFEGRPVTYGWTDLDELVLGYACSIHKSQGSEYPAVIIPLHTQHYVLLQRNLLYTGITRGRRLVVVVGSRKAVAIAVRNNKVQARYTRLAERLAAAVADT
jgi:exodeoxyribonuclease V alpha subunit